MQQWAYWTAAGLASLRRLGRVGEWAGGGGGGVAEGSECESEVVRDAYAVDRV